MSELAGTEGRTHTRVSAASLRGHKVRHGLEPLVMLTAYDAPGRRIAEAAGVDVVLVGDSVAMVVLGHDTTLSVTLEEMAHHVAAVARGAAHGAARALVVGDMPWMSYHTGVRDATRNAARLVRAGAGAVKLEGGRRRVPVIEAIVGAEIPVMGHLGLTPQSVHTLGGYRVQARSVEACEELVEDALALQDAGCFAVVLECVPAPVAALVSAELDIPTVGIGAGAGCDGQVLVLHDLLGLGAGVARFVRRYADLEGAAVAAVAAWASDVRSGAFPSTAESYSLAAGELGAMRALAELAEAGRRVRDDGWEDRAAVL